jgi:hypothetical protein
VDCELDGGEVVHLKPGDVMVRRGNIHTWVNKGPAPAVTAFILIDATPDEVNDKEMRTVYPVQDSKTPAKESPSSAGRQQSSSGGGHAIG